MLMLYVVLPGGRANRLQSPGHCIEVQLLVSELSRSLENKAKTLPALNDRKRSGKNPASLEKPKDSHGIKVSKSSSQPEINKSPRNSNDAPRVRTKRIRIESDDDDVFERHNVQMTPSGDPIETSSKSVVVIDDADIDDDDSEAGDDD